MSGLQEPVPLPEPDRNSARPPDQQPMQSSDSEGEPQASAQSITGVILRQGEKYVLKAGDNTTYQLDDQNRASQYQDRQVQVVGTIDTASNTLHIKSIELTS